MFWAIGWLTKNEDEAKYIYGTSLISEQYVRVERTFLSNDIFCILQILNRFQPGLVAILFPKVLFKTGLISSHVS